MVDRHRERIAAGWIVLAYGSLAALGAALALAFGRDPLVVPVRLGLTGATSILASLALGVLVAGMTIALTRAVVPRAAWGRELHAHLRPVVRTSDDSTLLLLAIASSIGEELFFRGFLTQIVGVVLSSVAFGLLHQVRGRARWVWAAWAAVTGALFSGIFELSGHLAGPIAAHAAINWANLRYLRDTDPAPKPRPMGGLLAR